MFEASQLRPFPLPKLGGGVPFAATGSNSLSLSLVFKRTGWQPFYDPTYFKIQFRQGIAGRASNSSYVL